MPQTVTIAGNEYPRHCILTDTRLFVYLDSMSLMDGYAVVSPPHALDSITEKSYVRETTYTGYTEISAISGEYGNCNIVLKKGESNA